jgi:amino-acid N-acetyltransferase
MNKPATAGALFREVARLYVRSQRVRASCGNGASTVQCHVMTELLRDDGLTQQALVERLGLDKGWISRAADALVEDGTITKQVDPLNRRCVRLALTLKGRQRAHFLDDGLNSHAEQLITQLSKQQQAAVHTVMQDLLPVLRSDEPKKSKSMGVCSPPAQIGASSATAMATRAASSKDWVEIANILRAENLPLDGAQEQIVNFLIGMQEKKIVAIGGLEHYGSVGLMRSIAVLTEVQGQHYGVQMVQALCRLARKNRIDDLYLLTTTAQKYFARLGFVPLARDLAPAELMQSSQFQGTCPSSAILMHLAI